jgi:hypothetical protein
MNYRGIKDVQSGASAGFKAFYNGESASKTVSFTSRAGEVVTGLKLEPGVILPVESREVSSADAGVFGLY